MKKKMLMVVMAIMAGIATYAQKSSVFIESGKAIRGYDPVAYFTEGKPVMGEDSLKTEWNHANWYFSSRKNLNLFRSNPDKYAPQYGGYCAYGLSEGHKASIDANAWTIDNNKLYLNHSLDVKTLWNKDRKERIEKADKKWPEIKDKE